METMFIIRSLRPIIRYSRVSTLLVICLLCSHEAEQMCEAVNELVGVFGNLVLISRRNCLEPQGEVYLRNTLGLNGTLLIILTLE